MWYCACLTMPAGIGGRRGSSPVLAGPNCDSSSPSVVSSYALLPTSITREKPGWATWQ